MAVGEAPPRARVDEKKDWAARGTVLPKVAFGNSSTSSSVTTGGSNPRMLYTNPKGLPALYEQYTKNN